MTAPDDAPPVWPAGADEARVRECPCEWCVALADALDQAREGVAVDGEHRSLAAFSEGAEA